jgi:hypothetical protein
MKNQYYTYAYLREDGTPYYIGKGKGYRLRYKHRQGIKVPPLERVLVLKKNLTEEQAFRHEIYMIAVLGRKDLGTGILRNLTSGGEGSSGWNPSVEWREEARQRQLGRKHSYESIEKRRQKLQGMKRGPETIQKQKENCFRPSGYFWITDGVSEKWVEPETIIPKDWDKGRKPTSEETRKVMSDRFSGKGNPMFGVEPKTKQMRWYNLDNKEEKMYIPGEQPKGWELGRKKKVRLSALA